MDKLEKLIQQCKCGISISINEHRNMYEPVEQFTRNLISIGDFEVSPEIMAKIIETDTLVDVHFYPHTPNGFYKILHYDLNTALDMALAVFERR